VVKSCRECGDRHKTNAPRDCSKIREIAPKGGHG
jgi:hypothetical protein